MHLICKPERVLEIFRLIENALWIHSRISVHCGKTQLWNRSGTTPRGCEDLTRAARVLNPDAVVWRGDHRLPAVQGVVVLGSPVGHDEFIKAKLMSKVTEHQTLLERIPLVRDVQSAWLLLLFCAATRANYWLRTVRPDLTLQFAMAHDHDVLVCLSRLLEVPVETFALNATMSLPLSKGGLGLRSAVRSREAAHWASWAGCLSMVQKRHPQVAGIIGGEMASMNVARECVGSLADAGCVPPVPEDTGDPFQPRQGWQHFASNTVEELHLREALPALPPPQRALVRSQGGPLSSRPFVCCPTSRLTKFSLLRRLQLPLPLSSRNCRCGRPLDCLGHHRSACAVAEVLGRRGFAVESAIARIRREGGARVSTNVFVRDLDLGPFNHLDGRRLEVVADGLSLFGGAQLAIDTTLVSALRRDGTAREGAANRNGVAIRSAHRRKERTYPELAGARGRARLVILAGEVGGLWSPETAHFLRALAVAKARDVPSILQASVELLGSAVGRTSSHVQRWRGKRCPLFPRRRAGQSVLTAAA